MRPDDCVVPFDEWSGCAVHVERRCEPQQDFVELSFVLKSGDADTKYLPLDQAIALRAALATVVRTVPPTPVLDEPADCPRLRVIADARRAGTVVDIGLFIERRRRAP